MAIGINNFYRLSGSWQCLWNIKLKKSKSELNEDTHCVMVILAFGTVFPRNISICAVLRSVCWIPNNSRRLSKHSHYNGAVPTVSEHCFMNINTLSEGYCHSHEYLKENRRLTSSRFCDTNSIQKLLKRQRRKSFIGIQWRRQAQQPDGWHFTILHHHMKPCSSIYEEEQMVEASHPSFYSLQSNDPQRRWRCLLVIPQMERATQKQLADTGSRSAGQIN